MDKTIGQATISVDQEGYLTDFSQWTKEVGEEIAKEQGIEMTDKHWEIIDYINIKEFYALFPGGPLKKATMIAGIPKPKSCI